MVRFLLPALLFLSACFSVRTVEPPLRATSDWISPTDYEILLSNLSLAVQQANVQNYLRCFNRDSLRFVPVASLVNSNETIWSSWGIQDEQAYLENTLANLSVSSGQSLILNETDLQDVSSDSLRYVGRYTLRINHTDTALTTLFRGQLQLTIKRNDFNEWEVHRWTDIELAPDSSWSLLKLRYAQ
jgi:hypothetical protein